MEREKGNYIVTNYKASIRQFGERERVIMSAQLEWQEFECPVLSVIIKSLLQEIDR